MKITPVNYPQGAAGMTITVWPGDTDVVYREEDSVRIYISAWNFLE